jgi:hypothetical protein
MNVKKSIGAKNKSKGSHAERFYAKVFRELGYKFCITSRQGGRIYDNAGIDLMNIPYNVQIKAGIQRNMNPGKVLFNIDNQIKALFPEESDVRKYPIILIHRPNPFSNNTDNDTVYYTYEQHLRFKDFNKKLRYISIKYRKGMYNSEYGAIVNISFEDFKNLILIKNAVHNK